MKKEEIVRIVEQAFVGHKARIVTYCSSKTMSLWRVAVKGNGYKIESFEKLKAELKGCEIDIIVENDVLQIVVTKNYG